MRVLLLVTLALLTACQSVAPLPPLPAWQGREGLQHADLGLIRDLRSGATLTPAQLLEQLADAPRVLIGEQHDNADQHALQLWLLKALQQRREPGSLLLEMLNPEQQSKVAATQAASRARQMPVALPAALAWQASWDWALYGPIIRYALLQPAPLLAANLDRDEIMTLYRTQPRLPAGQATQASVQAALLAQIETAHCGLLPTAQLPAMLAVQQQRDRRMAERLLAAPTPAVLLAGAFHVRRDLGVPLHLQDLTPQVSGERVLMLAEVGQRVSAASADFVWYTPAMPAQDHCASMRPSTR